MSPVRGHAERASHAPRSTVMVRVGAALAEPTGAWPWRNRSHQVAASARVQLPEGGRASSASARAAGGGRGVAILGLLGQAAQQHGLERGRMGLLVFRRGRRRDTHPEGAVSWFAACRRLPGELLGGGHR